MREKTNGFTLIETLVALFVLTFALAGPLSLAFDSLQTARTNKATITSFYLAQEGIEFVKNVRDSNKVQGHSWLTGLAGANNCEDRWCEIDPVDPQPSKQVKKCGSGHGFGDCKILTYHSATGLFSVENHDGDTGIRRGIRLTDVNAFEADVESRVEWMVHGVTYSYSAFTTLYDLKSASDTDVPICGDGYCMVGEDDTHCPTDCGAGSNDPNNFDGDNWPDAVDKCFCVFDNTNPQVDSDHDGVGDLCDSDVGGGPLPSFIKCCDATCGR